MDLEQDLINIAYAASPEFIGDDAAIITDQNNYKTIISHDQLLENIHFRTNYFSPKNLAYKTLHANLSDIAAMGGQPKYILCGIAIPKHHHTYAKQFLQALTTLCKTYKIILIGGDTTASTHDLMIGITIIGHAKTIKHRSTAAAQDIIACVGELGWAHLGLTGFEKQIQINKVFQNAYLRPSVKLTEGKWLAQCTGVTAMMDLSDGLLLDLAKLCKASQCGAHIQLDNIEHHPKFITQCHALSLNYHEVACIGGEDYGLLCTLNPLDARSIQQNFINTFGYPMKILGILTQTPVTNYILANNKFNFTNRPFQHFS